MTKFSFFPTELPRFKAYVTSLRMMYRKKSAIGEILGISERLHQEYFQGGSFKDIIQCFCSLCLMLDRVKVKTIGRKASTHVSNQIMRGVAYLIALKNFFTQADLERLAEIETASYDSKGEWESWLSAKITILRNAVEESYETRRFATRLSSLIPDRLARMLEPQLPSIDQQITGMMQRLQEIRKYGVKPSYFNLRRITEYNSSWVFWGYQDVVKFPLPGMNKHYAAVMAYSPEKDHTDLRPSHEKFEGQGNVAIDYTNLPLPAYFSWQMDWNGDLDLDAGMGQSCVKLIFEQEGKLLQYHSMRLHLVMCLYDLIAPLEIVKGLPKLVRPRQNIVERAINSVTDLVVKSPISRLLVPRMKALDNMALVTKMLDEELEEGESKTASRSTKRNHQVVAHIRRLPEGHTASPQARQLAWEEFGIKLQDGETFVQQHERGSGEKITSHAGHRRPKWVDSK